MSTTCTVWFWQLNPETLARVSQICDSYCQKTLRKTVYNWAIRLVRKHDRSTYPWHFFHSDLTALQPCKHSNARKGYCLNAWPKNLIRFIWFHSLNTIFKKHGNYYTPVGCLNTSKCYVLCHLLQQLACFDKGIEPLTTFQDHFWELFSSYSIVAEC